VYYRYKWQVLLTTLLTCPISSLSERVLLPFLLLKSYSPLWTLACNTIFLYFRQSLAAACPIYSHQLYCFLNEFVFYAQPPSLEDQGVWNLTLDLSGMGDPASSYATAGIALEIMGSQVPSKKTIDTSHSFNQPLHSAVALPNILEGSKSNNFAKTW
jgi:hypothetical protein